MKKLSILLACAGLVAALGSSAASATTFNFSFSGATDSGSGVLTASPTATPGKYLITGVSGTTDGSAIAGLLAPGAYPVNLGVNDNLLFFPPAGTSFFDIFGMSYQLANGTDINLYYGQFGTGDPVQYNLISGVAETNSFLDRVIVTPIGSGATPEPATLLLVGTAGLALIGLARRGAAGITVCRISQTGC